jgi:hypothetical protein
LLPGEVTASLLRFHAQYGDAARKLSVAGAIPGSALTAALNTLVELGNAAVTAIETSLGITKPPAEAAPAKPAPTPVPAPAATTESRPTSEAPRATPH